MTKIISSDRSRVWAIRLYPSPFEKEFNIDLPPGELIEYIKVIDMTGKNIPVRYRQAGQQCTVTVLNELPKQVLFVQLMTNKRGQAIKIIKK
jgi:hypothetical protein